MMSVPQDELQYIADSVCSEIAQANEDDGQVIHAVLDKYKYDSLSESDKLFVLTHTRYNDKMLSLSDVYQIECCESGNTDGVCWICHRSCIARAMSGNCFRRCKVLHEAKHARIIAPAGGHMALPPPVDLPQVGNMGQPLLPGGNMAPPPPVWNMAPSPPVWNISSSLPVWNMAPPLPPVGNMAPPPLVWNMAPPPAAGNMAPPLSVWNMVSPPPPLANMAPPPSVWNMAPPPPVPPIGNMPSPPLVGNMSLPPPILPVRNMPPPPQVENMAPPPLVGNIVPPPPVGHVAPPSPVWNMGPLPSSGYTASLTRIVAWPPAVRNVPPVKNPLWKYVITSDKVNCMKALLSRTPLYAIHKENIPPKQNWIKRAEWMLYILVSGKARWSTLEVCKYHCDDEVSTKALQFHAMSQIAFTMHAAELFSQCCKFNAVKCMEYLLDKAPFLIHMKAGSGHNRLALNTALLYASPVTKVLLRNDAVVAVGKEDSASTLAAIYVKQRCYHNDIRQATELLCHGNEDVISQYEYINSPGETLLHMLYDSFDVHKHPLPKLEDTVFCTKLLLKSGADPTKTSFLGTALDILIANLIPCCFSSLGTDVKTRKSALAVQTVSACVQILLPVSKGKAPGDYNLPASLMDLTTASRESIRMEVIRVFQLALDNGLYCGRRYFLYFKWCLTFPKPNPCSFCAPAVRLLFTFLCHQSNQRKEKRFLNRSISMVTPSTKSFLMQDDVCHASDGQLCVLHECCFWEMYELIVQAGAMDDCCKDKILNENTTLCDQLNFIKSRYRVHFRNGCFTILQRFARIFKVGWIHYTSKPQRNSLEVCIKKFARKATNDYAMSVAEELYEFTRNVLPLKTLTRQVIMQHVIWKDVKHLPLPTALKVYVRVGELSAEHPVHLMSKAQLAA